MENVNAKRGTVILERVLSFLLSICLIAATFVVFAPFIKPLKTEAVLDPYGNKSSLTTTGTTRWTYEGAAAWRLISSMGTNYAANISGCKLNFEPGDEAVRIEIDNTVYDEATGNYKASVQFNFAAIHGISSLESSLLKPHYVISQGIKNTSGTYQKWDFVGLVYRVEEAGAKNAPQSMTVQGTGYTAKDAGGTKRTGASSEKHTYDIAEDNPLWDSVVVPMAGWGGILGYITVELTGKPGDVLYVDSVHLAASVNAGGDAVTKRQVARNGGYYVSGERMISLLGSAADGTDGMGGDSGSVTRGCTMEYDYDLNAAVVTRTSLPSSNPTTFWLRLGEQSHLNGGSVATYISIIYRLPTTNVGSTGIMATRMQNKDGDTSKSNPAALVPAADLEAKTEDFVYFQRKIPKGFWNANETGADEEIQYMRIDMPDTDAAVGDRLEIVGLFFHENADTGAKVSASVTATRNSIGYYSYQLQYDANGGTGTVPATQTGGPSGKTNHTFIVSDTAELTRPGYTFAGWSSNAAVTAPTQPALVQAVNSKLSVSGAGSNADHFAINGVQMNNEVGGQTATAYLGLNGNSTVTDTHNTINTLGFYGWVNVANIEAFGYELNGVVHDETLGGFDNNIATDLGLTSVLGNNAKRHWVVVDTASLAAGTYKINVIVKVSGTWYRIGNWPTVTFVKQAGAKIYSGEEVVPGGYYYKAASNGEKFGTTTTTMYAVWVPNVYNITYSDGNADVPAVGNPTTYTAGVGVPSFTAPEKYGYKFGGWFDTGLGQIVTSIGADRYGDVSLRAEWTTGEYNISYVLNGGTLAGVNYTEGSYLTTDAVVLPSAEKDGYSFAGWVATTAEGSWELNKLYTMGQSFAQGSMYGNVTLTAQWTRNDYVITYHLNDGNDTTSQQTFNIEEAVTLTANPTREGYIFRGWKALVTGGSWVRNEIYSGTLNGAWGDVDLYAQWEAIPYIVTIVYNDGTAYTYTFEYGADVGVTMPSAPSGENMLGMSFAGWKITSADDSWSAVDQTKLYQTGENVGRGCYGDVTFTAQWAYDTYRITFNLNGGTMDGELYVDYQYIDAIVLPVPTLEGYEFMGWKVLGTAGNWSASEPLLNGTLDAGRYGNVSLGAQWQMSGSPVNYYVIGGVGGTLSIAYETVPNGVEATGSQPTALEGYCFRGWFLDANCVTAVPEAWVSDDGTLKPVINETGVYKYYAKFEHVLYSLIMTPTVSDGSKLDQSFIYEVTVDPQADILSDAMVIFAVLEAGDTVCVDIPVGGYVVTESKDWNWRYATEDIPEEGVSGVCTTGDVTLAPAYALENSYWLNAYARVSVTKSKEQV